MELVRIFLSGFLAILIISCNSNKKDSGERAETEPTSAIEMASQTKWENLFDGSNFDHWRGYLMEDMPAEWTIEDGAMAFTPGEEGGKNIISQNKYTNFVLSLEWK